VPSKHIFDAKSNAVFCRAFFRRAQNTAVALLRKGRRFLFARRSTVEIKEYDTLLFCLPSAKGEKMKNAKRLSAWILVVALVVSLSVFTACVDKPHSQELTELVLPTLTDSQMAVIIKNGDKDYTSIVVSVGKNKTAEDVLTYLKDEGTITLEWNDSDFGKFITKIGKAAPSSQSEWIGVYTSDKSQQDTSAYAKTYTVGEVSVTTSGLGVSALKVAAGDVLYFELCSM